MTHELFKLAAATPEQLNLVMAGYAFVAVVVAIGAVFVYLDARRGKGSVTKGKPADKQRRRRRRGPSGTDGHMALQSSRPGRTK